MPSYWDWLPKEIQQYILQTNYKQTMDACIAEINPGVCVEGGAKHHCWVLHDGYWATLSAQCVVCSAVNDSVRYISCKMPSYCAKCIPIEYVEKHGTAGDVLSLVRCMMKAYMAS